MKIKNCLDSRWVAILLLLFATILTTDSFGQQKNPLLKPPDGNWTFGIYPYHGSDSKDLPVTVGLVSSEVDVGVGATKVGIVNNSNKAVAAIRFKWLLFEADKRNKILQQGSSPLLGLRTTLQPEEKRILLYQVVSLLKVNRPLLKDNLLNGNYEVEILVEEVYFADNSVWKKDDKQQSGQKDKSKNSDFKIIAASLAQCPKQKCKSANAGTGGTVYYSCETSEFAEVCSVGSNARSCTVTACGFGGGGTGGPGNGGGYEEPIIIDYP